MPVDWIDWELYHAIKRVETYYMERIALRGTDPHIIHTIWNMRGKHDLLSEDLRLLTIAARKQMREDRDAK